MKVTWSAECPKGPAGADLDLSHDGRRSAPLMQPLSPTVEHSHSLLTQALLSGQKSHNVTYPQRPQVTGSGVSPDPKVPQLCPNGLL